MPTGHGGRTSRKSHGGAPRSRLVVFVAAVLLLTLAAAAYVQSRQLALLNLTIQYQDDYLMVSLNQLESEYLRLFAAMQEATHQTPPKRASLQLRYDIFVSRADLLDTPRVARVVDNRGELKATLQRLRDFIARGDAVLGPSPALPLTTAAAQALLAELTALGEPVHTLTLDASHHVAAQVATRNMAVRRHNQVSTGLTVLMCVTGLVFAFITMRQMRQLDQRRLGLERLAANLREARREAEAASQAKSAFLANMSHEIRTPFQGLLGMLSLLRDSRLDAQQLDHLRTATESADYLLTILNDILDMSKLEAGSLSLLAEPVRLSMLVRDVEALMRPQAAAKGLRFAVALQDGLPDRVMADPTRLKQVLFNLLSNAIKFSDAGSVDLAVRREAGQLSFSVADTGVGIDEATLGRLFQRFTQGDASRSRRHGGTGLGLEISRNLARLMGGDIAVQSRPGAGSTFVFTLPLVDAPADAVTADHGPRPAAQPSRRLRLLAAEDHPVNRKYLAALIDRLGHDVVFAENGAEALERAQERATEQPFDLVLMDLHMPVLDGVGAAVALRAMPPPHGQVPIIAVSADVFPESRARCLAAGMNDFLAKPIDVDGLAGMLARHAPAQPPRPAEAPVAPLVETPAVLDEQVLSGVLSVLSKERYAGLASGLLQDTARAASGMRAAARRGEMPALRRDAHATKGAALNLGLRALGAAAQQLQQMPEDVSFDALDALVLALEARLADTEAALDQLGLLAPRFEAEAGPLTSSQTTTGSGSSRMPKRP